MTNKKIEKEITNKFIRRKYMHYKDFRDCQLISIGKEHLIPKNEPVGTITHIKHMFSKYIGKKLYKLLNDRNHNSMVFEKCKCYIKNGT